MPKEKSTFKATTFNHNIAANATKPFPQKGANNAASPSKSTLKSSNPLNGNNNDDDMRTPSPTPRASAYGDGDDEIVDFILTPDSQKNNAKDFFFDLKGNAPAVPTPSDIEAVSMESPSKMAAKVSPNKRQSPYKRPNPKENIDPSKLDPAKYETNTRVLQQRQKQIDFGKNTLGYDRYVQTVPKNKRSKGEPRTPDKYKKMSKRCWDGIVKAWRRQLHSYDPPKEKGEEGGDVDDDDVLSGLEDEELDAQIAATLKDALMQDDNQN